MKRYIAIAQMLVLILPMLLAFPGCKKKSSNTAPPACYTNKTGVLFFSNPSPLSDTFTILIATDTLFANLQDSFTLASGQLVNKTFTLGKRYIDAYYYTYNPVTRHDTSWSFIIVGCDSDSIALTSIQTVSDRRLKKNIVPLDAYASLEKLLQLPAYSFEYDRPVHPEMSLPEGRFNGFMAQDMECLFPELVQTNKNGYYSVNYTGMIPVLAKAIQEQQQQIQELQKEVKELKAGRDKGI